MAIKVAKETPPLIVGSRLQIVHSLEPNRGG